ncbi:MAG: hypothetical protein JW846_02315, partial [Dehalococcoidia bacterium]|nr:hypothetical protein [Dehalococcoidia bacterium]
MMSLRTTRVESRVVSLFILVALALTLCASPALASESPSEWSEVPTPTDDELVILPGSDIIDYAVAGPFGSTLYAIGLWYDECLEADEYQYWKDDENVLNEQLVPRLWKSDDGGLTWKDRTAKVQSSSGMPADEEFVFFSAVAAAPDDEDFVIVAGYTKEGYNDSEAIVAGSIDGAAKFTLTGCDEIPGEITCMDVSPERDGIRQMAAGTKDLIDGGRVWRLESGGFWHGYWGDTTEYDGWLAAPAWDSEDDVFAITSLEFSPNFDYDETLVGMAIGLGYSPTLATSFDPDPIGAGNGFFPAFYYFMGNWNDNSAWNGDAWFENYPGMFATSEALFYASTYYYGGGWTEYFESPFLRMATDIALPWDFTGEDATDRTALVSINGTVVPAVAGMPAGEGGFLFLMMDMAPAFELLNQDDNPFVSSVAYHGSIMLMGDAMVGLACPEEFTSTDLRDWYLDGDPSLPCCKGVTVLYTDTPISRNPCCPDNWGRAQKNPTGQFNARVDFDRDGGRAYASTQGFSFRADETEEGYWSDESAFSVSPDRGSCWNQSGLIDTDIDFIADMVVNPACGELLVATVNYPETYEGCDCDSVWRSDDGGESYLRVWNGALTGDYNQGSEWPVLDVPPQETEEIATVYMADLGTGTVYYATNGGLCRWESRNTGLNDIADISVLDSATIYVLDADGQVAKSSNNARRWDEPVDSKVSDDSGERAHNIVSMGDWILLGGDKGTVSYSNDRGDSYAILDDIGDGQVHVAFDSYFEDNGYVYAAVALGDSGIFRTTIANADFEDMNACNTLDYWGIVLSSADGNPKTSASTGGVLYASYNNSDDCANSGVARILNPASQDCCGSLSWDYLFESLWADAEFSNQPTNLEICGCLTPDTNATLWAIDFHPYYNGWNGCHDEMEDSDWGRLWKFTDCFAKAGPELIGVDDDATIPSDPCDCVNEDFILEWDRLCNACEYDIQIALDEGFKHVIYSDVWDNADHGACDGILANECESPISFYKPSDPCAPSLVIDQGTLDCNQTYWWRVRARFAETGEAYRSQ